MRNIAFLNKESGMSHFDIMRLPYGIFLSYLKYYRLFMLEETEEGRKALYQCSILEKTEPEWNKLRNQKGYRKVESEK